MTGSSSIAPFYRGWHLTNEALVAALRPLSKEQLQLASGSPDWPIWASAAHDPAHPRRADELVGALESSWKIVERSLKTWTPEMLDVEFPRTGGAVTRLHTRQSVLIRLLTHDAYHCGEISLTLGAHGLGELELWSGLSRPV